MLQNGCSNSRCHICPETGKKGEFWQLWLSLLFWKKHEILGHFHPAPQPSPSCQQSFMRYLLSRTLLHGHAKFQERLFNLVQFIGWKAAREKGTGNEVSLQLYLVAEVGEIETSFFIYREGGDDALAFLRQKKKILCPVELGQSGEIRWEREVVGKFESLATVKAYLSGNMLNQNV